MEKTSGLRGLLDEVEKEEKAKKKKQKKMLNEQLARPQNSSESFKGLMNFGNACYSNVVIQCLTSISEFLETINSAYSIVEREDDVMEDYPVLSRVVEIMNYYKIKNTSMASKLLQEIIHRFDKLGEQNDAHEFLVFLLDNLNQEMIRLESKYKVGNYNKIKEVPSKKDDEGEWEEVKKGNKRMKQTNSLSSFVTSTLGNVFQGVVKQDILEKGKALSNCQIEPFFVLSLGLNGDVLDVLMKNMFSKSRIDGNYEKSTQSYFEKIPNILIINVKGFYYDKVKKSIVKITRQLVFEDTLVIKKEYFSPSLRENDIHFDLIGLIVHKGAKASEGHYVCYCKDNNNVWFYIDDKRVMSVAESAIHNLRPYILFYRKKK